MSTFARHGHRSKGRQPLYRAARGLAAAFAVAILPLLGCGADPLEPTGPRTTGRADAPFQLRLRSDHIDESQCGARVTATADGGGNGAHAAWGQLRGRAYDFETHELVRGRTQPLHPEVFPSPTIDSGETQWGEVDLEWFRRDAGEPVMVELEFHARLHEGGGSGTGEPQVTRLSLACR